MLKKILFFLVLLFSNFTFSQSILLSKDAKISILNCGTGNESYSLYGHTAIRIQDRINFLDLVFNYGTFDFSTPNFALKFVKGDLQYFVSTNSYADFEYSYRLDQRSIYEQELNLNQEQKQILFDKLWQSLQSDDRFYTYKFIDRNCTTMVIDKVNEVLGSEVVTSLKPITKTYRDVLYPYVENHFFEKLGINIMFGAKVDQPAERLFLPLDFIQSLEQAQYNGKPLAKTTKIIYQAPEDNFKPSVLNSIYTVILILALIVLVRKKVITNSYFFISGILGLFFCLVGLYSEHQEVLWNYNALLFNPFYLVLFYFLIKKQLKQSILMAKILIAMLLGYLVYMLNKIHLGIVMPFIVAHFILLAKIALSDKITKKSFFFYWKKN